MIQEFNSKFNEIGVYIESVVVLKVIIPKLMREAQAETTTFDVHL